MIFEICSRCHRPITSNRQICRFKGQVWRCVPRSDKTVVSVDDLLIKTGNDAKPVPILDDHYGP